MNRFFFFTLWWSIWMNLKILWTSNNSEKDKPRLFFVIGMSVNSVSISQRLILAAVCGQWWLCCWTGKIEITWYFYFNVDAKWNNFFWNIAGKQDGEFNCCIIFAIKQHPPLLFLLLISACSRKLQSKSLYLRKCRRIYCSQNIPESCLHFHAFTHLTNRN